MGLILSFFYPALILLNFYILFRYFPIYQKILIKNKKYLLFSFLSFFILGVILLYIFFKNENNIYFWDFATYWEWSLKINNVIQGSLSSSLEYIYKSLISDEYTLLPALFLSLPTLILGNTFTSFIISSFIFFVLPFLMLLQIFILRISEHFNFILRWKLILLPIMIFTFQGWYYSLLSGYIDILGQVFVVLLWIYYFDQTEKNNIIKYIIMLINLLLLAFTRRWYIIWIVSYFLSIGLFLLIMAIKKRIQIRELLNYIFLGLFFLIIIILLFNPYFQNLINNQYSTLYEGYRLPTFLDNLNRYLNYYGGLFLVISVSGYLNSFRNKETFKLIIPMLLTVLLSLIIFMQVQSMDLHHFQLINLSIFFGFLLFFFSIKKVPLTLMLMILVFFNSLQIFTPIKMKSNLLFSTIERLPIVRSDKSDLIDLAYFINTLISEDKYMYVAPTNEKINDDLLRNINFPDQLNYLPNLEAGTINDKRDGFPKDFFLIDYVLTTIPAQLNSSYITDQKINLLINNSILYNSLISRNYENIYTQKIDNYSVIIFKRIDNYDSEERLFFKKSLQFFYPNYQYIYESIEE